MTFNELREALEAQDFITLGECIMYRGVEGFMVTVTLELEGVQAHVHYDDPNLTNGVYQEQHTLATNSLPQVMHFIFELLKVTRKLLKSTHN